MQRSTQKTLDPRKNIFDPRNPRKNYDPRKSILTHVTHATHVKIWPTQPTDRRNLRYHATHAI